jgi:hypothetical protein
MFCLSPHELLKVWSNAKGEQAIEQTLRPSALFVPPQNYVLQLHLLPILQCTLNLLM